MFEAPKFVSSSINIIFDRQREIRKKQFDFEEILKGRYAVPAQVISVPDDLDPQIPRVLFTSEHGFSQVAISQINMALNVRYSDEWQKDIIKNGSPYLKERVPILFELLHTVNTDIKPNFCGCTLTAKLQFKKSDDDLIKIISKKYCNIPEKEKLYDISTKISKRMGEDFFSNITVANYRTWKIQKVAGVVKFKVGDAIERGLELTVDYNDRQSFNNKDSYSSSAETLNKIVESAIGELITEIKSIQ